MMKKKQKKRMARKDRAKEMWSLAWKASRSHENDNADDAGFHLLLLC